MYQLPQDFLDMPFVVNNSQFDEIGGSIIMKDKFKEYCEKTSPSDPVNAKLCNYLLCILYNILDYIYYVNKRFSKTYYKRNRVYLDFAEDCLAPVVFCFRLAYQMGFPFNPKRDNYSHMRTFLNRCYVSRSFELTLFVIFYITEVVNLKTDYNAIELAFDYIFSHNHSLKEFKAIKLILTSSGLNLDYIYYESLIEKYSSNKRTNLFKTYLYYGFDLGIKIGVNSVNYLNKITTPLEPYITCTTIISNILFSCIGINNTRTYQHARTLKINLRLLIEELFDVHVNRYEELFEDLDELINQFIVSKDQTINGFIIELAQLVLAKTPINHRLTIPGLGYRINLFKTLISSCPTPDFLRTPAAITNEDDEDRLKSVKIIPTTSIPGDLSGEFIRKLISFQFKLTLDWEQNAYIYKNFASRYILSNYKEWHALERIINHRSGKIKLCWIYYNTNLVPYSNQLFHSFSTDLINLIVSFL